VISGLGKGITAASISLLLKSQGIKVSPVKADMYLNIDAGTMNPLEHGEIFVTDDGAETDQDLGHYERFLDQDLSWKNYLTAGQVYKQVIEQERALKYGGRCVEAYLHVPEEIIRRFEKLADEAGVVIVEYGGTVGEYQNVLFFEAARRLKLKYKENVLFIHVGYLPLPPSIGEMKTKPIQQSIHQLNELGIRPDIVICRSEKAVDNRRKEKIALAGALEKEDIISNPDKASIYEIPLVLEHQKISKRIMSKLGLKSSKKDLKNWQQLVRKIKKPKKKVKIGMAGKYYTSGGFSLEDSYISVVEAIKHAAWASKVHPEIVWFDSEKIEREGTAGLEEIDGMIVPQGWGSRGVEGKIRAIQFARENKVPYLGLCFGMQMAVIEYARNVLGLKNANSTEASSRTKYPVIHIMPDQKKYLEKHQYGGTIRLGAWPCRLAKGTIVGKAYGKIKISERHRHRYEFNNRYRQRFEKKGLVISGSSPDGKLVEAIELSQKDHPFFVGTQFHPEYKSRPLNPHPLFLGLIKAAIA
ncbi:MAG TPA: CTP synthase, partial [Candidatus Bathyarchaeia archaeon]|nr:CTP synthase [Candidatus Bathyarchaeia archaeon]